MVEGDAELEEVPRISVDYCFLNRRQNGNEQDNEEIVEGDSVVLAMLDECTDTFASYVCRSKGVADHDNDWLITATSDELESWGYGGIPIILKSDQEHAILSLKRAVQGNRKGQTTLE